MTSLLGICRVIDAINERVGRFTLWLILGSVLISAGNAIVRKAFSMSSNALLEIQWYLFAGVYLLAAGYVYLRNEHVRIDALAGRWSARVRTWIEMIGIVIFILPLCAWVAWMSWPLLVNAWVSGEVSSNAGGLIRWPLYALMPVAFVLLAAQAVSEFIKRLAFVRGLGPDPVAAVREQSAEEKLIEDLKRQTLQQGSQAGQGGAQ